MYQCWQKIIIKLLILYMPTTFMAPLFFPFFFGIFCIPICFQNWVRYSFSNRDPVMSRYWSWIDDNRKRKPLFCTCSLHISSVQVLIRGVTEYVIIPNSAAHRQERYNCTIVLWLPCQHFFCRGKDIVVLPFPMKPCMPTVPDVSQAHSCSGLAICCIHV